MGIAQLNEEENTITIQAKIILYGDASYDNLSEVLAKNIADHWNEPRATVVIKNKEYRVLFDIIGEYAPALEPIDVLQNDNALNNYYRIEEFAEGDISFVDGVNSNTGYFKLANLLNNSTTAAHEFGHSLGLDHPAQLDIRGQGTPGIMYPRGSIVDPPFQYDPNAAPGTNGGTLNPFVRKVLQSDIDNLQLQKLSFNKNGLALIGDFTSVWHEKQIPVHRI
ncbi:MAG: peptidase M10 [Bacteroidetes bacterium]|nr:peptidase M10 [Bacteroidota bacterium]MBS1757428.1 peptidase M10 [Bacteroidota bacterium]